MGEGHPLFSEIPSPFSANGDSYLSANSMAESSPAEVHWWAPDGAAMVGPSGFVEDGEIVFFGGETEEDARHNLRVMFGNLPVRRLNRRPDGRWTALLGENEWEKLLRDSRTVKGPLP